MNFSLKQALKVLVVFACAVGVVGTSVMITNKNTDNAKNKNDSLWNVVDGNGNSDSDSDDSSTPTSGPNGEPLISKTESQVGKYADIDGDGTVDGIIFADLLFGGSKTWENNFGAYTIPTISSSKEYYVSQPSFSDDLLTEPTREDASELKPITAEVLTPVGNGNDRFYVMALNDIENDRGFGLSWYYAAKDDGISDYNTVTSQNFGTGKQNTLNMIDKWNNEIYGKQNDNGAFPDIWSLAQEKIKEGWFIPSKEELAVFGDNFSSQTKYFHSCLWSSSLDDEKYACILYYEAMGSYDFNTPLCLRFATTF